MKKKWISIGLVLLTLIFISVAAFRNKEIRADFAAIAPQQAYETVLANGRIAGSTITPLGFQKSGTIARIYAREGADVSFRDTLAALSNDEEKNAVADRANALRIAQINLEKFQMVDISTAIEQLQQAASAADLARTQLERQQKLFAESAAAQVDVDRARETYEIAASRKRIAENAAGNQAAIQKQLLASQVQQALVALSSAYIALSRTYLLAPEDGTIVERHADIGQVIVPGGTVVSFLPLDTLTHVELFVDESEVNRIVAGQKALVSLSTIPDKVFDAIVKNVLPSIDPNRGTATVNLSLADSSTSFMPDQTVSAQIITNTIKSALLAEQRFLDLSGDSATAFVLKNNSCRQVTVRARDIGAGKFLIDGGLAAGDTLITAPGLKPGARIRLKSPNPAKD